MKRFIILAALLLLALPAAAQAATAATGAGALDFSMTPQDITIHTFYNGTTVQVAGEAPAGSQVVVRFAGAPEAVAMKQKGKALGFLWMNLNTLHFSGVPRVFLVESSAPLSGLGAAGASLGLSGLTETISVAPATADRAMLVPELLKLKRKEGLYREHSGGVALAAPAGGVQKFSVSLAVPSRLSPGAYTVEVIAVKDGAVAARAARPLEARLVGIPAFLSNLAFNNAVWYGVLASVIAIIAGLGIGLVFQSKGAH
ncbi:MAG: hypothetical protein AUJ49_07895 [Desulfovibrionaceae bacterium CG1_02_65_16]|nr:MAG: hypothetical protein AUJ49_07895 [Desulfovibrionaceae bacterium CG1_02_65_16]